MAKISARGDREIARWRNPLNGAEYVLTAQGRLLYKWNLGASFVLATNRRLTLDGAVDHVRRGSGEYERV